MSEFTGFENKRREVVGAATAMWGTVLGMIVGFGFSSFSLAGAILLGFDMRRMTILLVMILFLFLLSVAAFLYIHFNTGKLLEKIDREI